MQGSLQVLVGKKKITVCSKVESKAMCDVSWIKEELCWIRKARSEMFNCVRQAAGKEIGQTSSSPFRAPLQCLWDFSFVQAVCPTYLPLFNSSIPIPAPDTLDLVSKSFVIFNVHPRKACTNQCLYNFLHIRTMISSAALSKNTAKT